MKHAACLSVAMLALATPARAETIDVVDNHGGRVVEYDARRAAHARRGVSVRIVGPCQSACTVVLRQLAHPNNPPSGRLASLPGLA